MNKELKSYKAIIVNDRTNEILKEFEIELLKIEAEKWRHRMYFDTFRNNKEFLELQDKLIKLSGLEELQSKTDDELIIELIRI